MDARQTTGTGPEAALIANIVSLVARWELGAAYRLSARAAHAGLSLRELLVLSELTARPDGLVNGQLGGLLGVSSSTVADDLAGLRRRGLVEREGHPDDRRHVVSWATEAGRRLVEREQAPSGRRLAASLSTLGPEQLRVLGVFVDVAADLAYSDSREIREPMFGPRRHPPGA